MYCPKCGTENPDDAQLCNSCSSALTSTPTQAPALGVKTSGLAIAALVLGILSIFTLGLTAIPAIILGIISLVIIEKSGGRITGRAFAIGGIVVPVLVSFVIFVLLMPALVRVREIASRMVCGTNLSGIGKAMLLYSNDYNDELPRAGGINSVWGGRIPNWLATNRYAAYGLSTSDGGSGGQATITSSFYLLVKYVEVTPKSFICKGDSGTNEFKPYDYPAAVNRELIDLWDFGPEPTKHCSYSYHMPYGLYALTTSSEPGMAVAADRNPFINSPAGEAKSIVGFDPRSGREAVNIGNAIAHQEDGQNVLFMDWHVSFEKRATCGINDDNIYTFGVGGDLIGTPPIPGVSSPAHRLDSFLVNDGEGGAAPPLPPPKGRGCFLADTPVWVNGALVQISKAVAGQKVGCLATTASLEKLEEHEGSFECRDITLENGNRISVVEAHCFMLDSGQWVAAQNLQSGMKLKSLNGAVAIKSVVTRATTFVGKVYNLKVKSAEKYTVGKDGVIVRDY